MGGLVGCNGGGKEHALGVIVAVEAMKKGKEDGIWGVCGDMFEMHAGELGGGEERKLTHMLQTACVRRDDAIGGGEGGHGRK